MPAPRSIVLAMPRPAAESAADIYNAAGDGYLSYADGDPDRLFAFEGAHAYADRQVWAVLAAKLRVLRAAGADAVRILDAGCGPGTWLRRLVTQARLLGFASITARGFDVAEAQIEVARRMSRELAAEPGVSLRFEVADLTAPLPEADGSVDIALCLHSVLSHLPRATLPAVAAEFSRVTRGHFIATVRAIGSPPTAFVDSVENARELRMDHGHDRCEIERRGGRRIAVDFHLFGAAELRACFAGRFEIEDLRGLDIFPGRFLPDRRWNPESLGEDVELTEQLAALEEAHAHDPAFLERATHLLLVARRVNRLGRSDNYSRNPMPANQSRDLSRMGAGPGPTMTIF